MVVSGMKTNMRRREFLGLVGGMAAAWPFDSYAQERVRRVGVLTNLSITAGARVMPIASAPMRQNWSHSDQT
jgi:hypothetical protein